MRAILRQLSFSLALVSVVLLPGQSWAQLTGGDRLIGTITPAQYVETMRAGGFTAELSSDVALITLDGIKHAVVFFACENNGCKGYSIITFGPEYNDLAKINEFNAGRYLMKATIEEGKIVASMDVWIGGGVSQNNFYSVMRFYKGVLSLLIEELL